MSISAEEINRYLKQHRTVTVIIPGLGETKVNKARSLLGRVACRPEGSLKYHNINLGSVRVSEPEPRWRVG